MSNFLNFAGNQGVTFKNHGTGGGTSFTLDVSASTNSVLLTIGGCLQAPGTDYTVSGTAITTTTSVTAGIEVLSWVIHKPGTAPVIQDNSVTGAKIALTSQAEGDLMYCNSSGDWVRLAKGTAGQVLAQNSGLTAPEWVDPSGGAYDILAYQALPGTFSATENITWTTTQANTYAEINVHVFAFAAETNSGDVYMRIYENTTLNTTTYRQQVQVWRSNSATIQTYNSNADTKMNITPGAAGFYAYGVSGTPNGHLGMNVTVPTLNAARVPMRWEGTYMVAATFEEATFRGGGTGFAGSFPITGIQLYSSAGNCAAGYVVTGLKTA